MIELYLHEPTRFEYELQDCILHKIKHTKIEAEKIFNRTIKGIEKEKKEQQLRRRVILHNLLPKLKASHKKRLFLYMVNSGISNNIWLTAYNFKEYQTKETAGIYFAWFLKTKDDVYLYPVLKTNPKLVANRLEELWNLKVRFESGYRNKLIRTLAPRYFSKFAFLKEKDPITYIDVLLESGKKIPVSLLEKHYSTLSHDKKMEFLIYTLNLGQTKFADKHIGLFLKNEVPDLF